MSREKRYVFKMTMTADQMKLLKDTVDECLGISCGEKIIATMQPCDGTMVVLIVPPEESRILEVQLKAMRERTDVDNLGLIG